MWRDGTSRTLDVHDLVPGDVVDLSIGGIVPADLRLIEATHLACDEAVLTGESVPAEKSADTAETSTSPLDLSSCAFMGSSRSG